MNLLQFHGMEAWVDFIRLLIKSNSGRLHNFKMFWLYMQHRKWNIPVILLLRNTLCCEFNVQNILFFFRVLIKLFYFWRKKNKCPTVIFISLNWPVWKYPCVFIAFKVRCCLENWETQWTKLGSTHLCVVKPIYWHQVVVKESAAFISGCQSRSPGQLVLKNTQTPWWVSGKHF